MENKQKEKAIELLKQLDIYKPYIKGFKENDQVCFFEEFGGFWVDQERKVYNKMKELELEYDCKVYAITHEYTQMGEMYSFLLVTCYPDEWDTLVEKVNNVYYAFAYVWNVDDDLCSEFGTIGVISFGGGIKRIY